MKYKFRLTIQKINKDKKFIVSTDEIETIETDDILELVSRFTLTIIRMHKAITEEEILEAKFKRGKEGEDDIPF